MRMIQMPGSTLIRDGRRLPLASNIDEPSNRPRVVRANVRSAANQFNLHAPARYLFNRGVSKRLSLRVATVLLRMGTTAARSDLLILKDGRQFEGRALSEQNGDVQFDTVIAGIRATISCKQAEIKSLEKKPLAADFFGQPEQPAA